MSKWVNETNSNLSVCDLGQQFCPNKVFNIHLGNCSVLPSVGLQSVGGETQILWFLGQSEYFTVFKFPNIFHKEVTNLDSYLISYHSDRRKLSLNQVEQPAFFLNWDCKSFINLHAVATLLWPNFDKLVSFYDSDTTHRKLTYSYFALFANQADSKHGSTPRKWP